MSDSVEGAAVCPYCGEALDARATNSDHIFVNSLGGRAELPVHTDCNSRIGHAIEGKLIKPGAYLGLHELRGHVDDDPSQHANFDLSTGVPRRPGPCFTRRHYQLTR